MFNLRSTEDCDPDDDLLNEFLNYDDLSEAALTSIDHVASKELSIQSEPGADGVSSGTLRRFSGEDNVPSNEQVPSNNANNRENGSTDHQNANGAQADELNRLFEDEDDQYSSSLNNDQLILNSKVSERRPRKAIESSADQTLTF